MKQPGLGIVSSVTVMALSLVFIAAFTVPALTTWVAFVMISLIPMTIVIGVTWGAGHPASLSRHSQPIRGILYLLLVLATGAVVALIHFLTVGGRISPPTPMLSMCIITSVVITFWFAIMWGGWPFTKLVKNPVVAGLVMLAAAYVVNWLLFRAFFDFGFMKGSPAYVAALDPRGLFDAWNAQVFSVTALSGMFLMLNFELWPLTRKPSLTRQPLLGLIWTAAALGIGAIGMAVGTELFGLDAPVFMVRVPIPFIFGSIIVLKMMEDSIFKRFSQPLKGVLNATVSVVVGVVLARLFAALAPVISGAMESGPPGYMAEVWLASALLAVTFPFLTIFADLFRFWPLRRSE